MSFLKEILEYKKYEVELLKKKDAIKKFKDCELFYKNCFSLYDKLAKARPIGIIAEIKKASPSKGIISHDFDIVKIYEEYLEAGADAISILTDEKFFLGSIDFLKEIAIRAAIPLLKKDFIIDEIQIYQAKAYGADAILLISEILSQMQIDDYLGCASELGMSVLIESHKEESLKKLNFDKVNLIGINNRNLETFAVDVGTTERIIKLIPEKCLVVSESGIDNKDNLTRVIQVGAKAILVGETFMKAENKIDLIKEYKNFAAYVKS